MTGEHGAPHSGEGSDSAQPTDVGDTASEALGEAAASQNATAATSESSEGPSGEPPATPPVDSASDPSVDGPSGTPVEEAPAASDVVGSHGSTTAADGATALTAEEAVSPEGDVASPDAGGSASAADESAVAAVTAADVPALEGCDVERAWEQDETCAETETADDGGVEPAVVPQQVAERTKRAEQKAERATESVPWWPFALYFGAWVLLAALAAYYLLQVPEDTAIFETDLYGYTVLGGLVLTAAGPLLILSTWLATWWQRRDGSRTGLLSSALLKGALATFGGVVVWWVMLVIVDTMRLGRSV